MGIFSRLGTLIKSNLNDLISKAEDPQKMLNQIVVDMQNQLVEAKKQVAISIADEKRLKKQWDDQVELGKEWERKAMLAVRAGDDGLAKEALTRKQEHDKMSGELSKQWQLQKTAVENLKTQLRGLNDKIEEAKRKKDLLIARQKRAEAQKAIQDTMRGLSDVSAFDSFERMSQKVDQIEAEADASTELGGELAGDTLQQKFKALDAGVGSDNALAELKAKMGLGPMPATRAALPESSGAADPAAAGSSSGVTGSKS
ncbi:MAG TPA: PspA/IM30 family protein [Polyangia bacterium]|jgi:phage shock protein A|nr:PspA/IM30 family protein [Polyangia bacterium]